MATKLERLGIVPEERRHLSYSQLNTYSDCPQKFKLSYLDHADREPQGPLIGGSIVHRIIELSEREGWWEDEENFRSEGYDFEENLVPAGVAIVSYHRALGDDVKQAGGAEAVRWGGQGNGENLAWWSKQGEFMLRRYQQTRATMDSDGWEPIEHGTEMRVEAHLPGVELPVVGFIDKYLMAERGRPVVIDWKTGKIGNANPMQFATYARLILETTGIVVDRGVAVFLRAALAARRVAPVRFEGLVDRMGEVYADLVRGVEAGIFPPHPSSFCKSCSVRSSCWYWREAGEEG